MSVTIRWLSALRRVSIPSLGEQAWQGLLVAGSLVVYTYHLADLFLHPLSPSNGPALLNDGGLAFRYASILAGALNIAIGWLVWRRGKWNALGVLLLVWGAGASAWSVRSNWASSESVGWAYLGYFLFFFGLGSPAIITFLYLYPTGKFYPGWAKPFALAAIGSSALIGVTLNLARPGFGPNSAVPNPVHIAWLQEHLSLMGSLFTLATLLAVTGPLLCVVARFRRAPWLERQQIKWLLWFLAVAAGMTVPSAVLSPGAETLQNKPLYLQVISFCVYLLYQTMGALASGIAILRHHLWDIDIVIRKTLVYSLLSGLLGLVYASGVITLQAILPLDRGQPSPLVIVLSTLVIAALFNPLRKRIQDFIDRRFYRQKYNAEKALAAFTIVARNETNISQLSDQLTATVQETMQPEMVSLWMSTPISAPRSLENQ